ncbi:MAG: NAD(P)/FAD-dependent oxidoreductase [Rhodoferax sp.]|nr:NAD(P)/FAD-dependent oxidoreductase [Rhodoferax sp.]
MTSSSVQRASAPHPTERFDVVIVGAGISGIGCAYMLRQQCPELSFVILESMESFGGTWLLHKYPGTRSDSDLYTFGYHFKPWIGKPIASRQEILDYLGSVIEDGSLAPDIRYRHQIQSANWSSQASAWALDVCVEGQHTKRIEAGFLWMCQGYYRHDRGYTPEWPGMEQFKGTIIHPQHWPEDLDLTGKRITVIGSGATAATLIPALADQCEHVTMLQRTPTFFSTGQNADALADELRKLEINPQWIHEIMRRKVVKERSDLIRRARTRPDALKAQLLEGIKPHLPEGFDIDRQFSPPYKPLQQRVAFVPEGDLFAAIRKGHASIVTDQIAKFDEAGIQLQSGERIDCDVVITATGFQLSVMGEIPFTVDGKAVDFSQTVSYRGVMFAGIPNMAWVYGYGRYSWTLRVELIGNFVCRLLTHMQSQHLKSVSPKLRAEDAEMELSPWIDSDDLNAGYMMRSVHRLPKKGSKPEWQHSQDYVYERSVFPEIDLCDTIFAYED